MDVSLVDYLFSRAEGRCEYCGIPQRFFTELFQVEHIVARQHRGQSDESNLAIACARCNRHKGPNLSGIDPQTDELTRLFNPRIDLWTEHFLTDVDGLIQGLTAIGRTTVYVLSMNATRRIELRIAIRAMEGSR